MTPSFSLLYTTFPNEEEAVRISRDLLEKRLIACANILGETKSLYFWAEKLEESKEISVFLKTTRENIFEVIKTLQSLHSYETPAILEIPVEFGSEPFLNWVRESVR
ncbi:MAG TPA: divalent-cation tolerance protein CutA [Alphaproteobacteria bacterium]|nr:divalent-cation tolerance protein CutA [Alphaproteobacteria bacterium]